MIIILEDKLNEIMLDNNISFLVFTNLYDNTIETIGNKNELKYISLIENLFGSIEHINIINDSLKDQIMPQSWSQGNVRCLVCKPLENIIIGLFYNEERSAIESYEFGKTLNDMIKNIFIAYNYK